jgi:hypothetical protein
MFEDCWITIEGKPLRKNRMNKLLWIMLSVLVALPIAANAEVYKWKDKDGVIRYSDSPPPSNIQKLPVNGKKPAADSSAKAASTEGAAPAAPTEGEGAAPATVAAPPPIAAKKKPAASLEGDAIKRQKEAEEEKKKNEQKEAELKAKQQNCTNAKANLNTYKQGGRIRKMNENGQREYLGDAEIAQGLEQAQKDVDQSCE